MAAPDDLQHRAELTMGVSLTDFYAYMPAHAYIFAPTREMWPAASVDARIPPIKEPAAPKDGDGIRASAWLDQNSPVEQMTWAPGLPMIIPDRLISEDGWIDRPNVRYIGRRPSDPPMRARPMVDHVGRVFPDVVNHIVKWLAHRVQQPQHKINHALVLGGLQVSEKTRSWSPSNTPSGRGISPKSRRFRSSVGLTAS